jgi:hypothetical protein
MKRPTIPTSIFMVVKLGIHFNGHAGSFIRNHPMPFYSDIEADTHSLSMPLIARYTVNGMHVDAMCKTACIHVANRWERREAEE